MHDIWNPWHGCKKYSEGCAHCYMYYLDRMRGSDPTEVYPTKGGFDYPLQRRRDGRYKVQSGELIRVCMTSDFFLPEADQWRAEAWAMMHERSDVKFWLLTKRVERIEQCLPADWGDGWENVMLNVTAENGRRADERIPILLRLPAKHKGVMCAPLIGPVELAPYLADGQIEQVLCGGENYDGARPCDYAWVKAMSDACRARNVTFVFTETGTTFWKDGKRYVMPSKRVQTEMAYRSGLSYLGKPVEWRLRDRLGLEIPQEELYVPHFRAHCKLCGMKLTCNGCSDCGKCEDESAGAGTNSDNYA